MNVNAGLSTTQPGSARNARPALRKWLHEGLRTLVLRSPRWEGLHTGPALLALLVVLKVLLTIGASRLYFNEAVRFNWRAGLAGWAGLLLMAWACFVLRPAPRACTGRPVAPSAVHLLSLLLVQSLWLGLYAVVLFQLLSRSGWLARLSAAEQSIAWLSPLAWSALAALLLMRRSGERHPGRRLVAVCALVLSYALAYYVDPAPAYWTLAPAQSSEEREEPLRFTQDSVEMQAPLLNARIAALKPQRAGVADMYTITFAPYEGEEVFRRESRMVSAVMASRFDAAGRGLQLMNHREELEKMPWATPLNLKRAIAGVAKAMDREEDVLFIHLTSHGASDAELAANFWPLDVDPVMPPDLKRWLDEAGIRHRVISISACYSGAWITPLAGDDTLVMTASDAEHTSYGCGKKSELTFFGRAMYDEQLRSKTLSFEQAHEAARTIIDKREKEAGKDDGYSNPQIRMGNRIRAYLERMGTRLGTPSAGK